MGVRMCVRGEGRVRENVILENGAILEEVLSSEAPRRNQRSGQSY
jgi:hypothetical protein